MIILKKFSNYDSFNNFCRSNKDYCPVKVEDRHVNSPGCHWCRVAYYHGLDAYKDEVVRCLE